MSEARDLVFFYNGVEMTDESVENVPVALPLPMKGGTMRRGRKVWTVVDVRNTEPLSTSGNPVYRILSFAKTPQQPTVKHATCYTTSLYLIHFKRADSSAEGQAATPPWIIS
jgi:hypothetical protein